MKVRDDMCDWSDTSLLDYQQFQKKVRGPNSLKRDILRIYPTSFKCIKTIHF